MEPVSLSADHEGCFRAWKPEALQSSYKILD